jgi:purine-binding chemotaxis protein CheW
MAAILIASLGDQRVGLRAEDVVEVVWAVALTPLPGAPEVVEGIMSVRGDVVPVVDPRPRFGYPRRALALDDRFVLVNESGRVVALRFDGADTVIDIDDVTISQPVSFGPPPSGIAGVVKLADGLILIHEMASFLSAAEASVLDEALSAREGGDQE